MKNTEEEKDVVALKDFKPTQLNLDEFSNMKTQQQFAKVKEILKSAYSEDTKILKEWILEVIAVTCSDKDDLIYLPSNLRVEKKNGIVTFKFAKKRDFNKFLIVIFLLSFAVGTLAATYFAVFYLSRAHLNKDIDGDGIPDINLDINNDGKAEINIDVDNDDKPDLNVDYKGNRKSIFNIDQDSDGVADFNMINDATSGKACSLNCDTDGDGWPELNIDLDGDGVADVDIDTDGDQIADLNLDTTGDGKCNLMCDTNNDGACDEFCIGGTFEHVDQSGTSTVTGDPSIDISTGGLVITYDNNVDATQAILPDDMSSAVPIPSRTFVIENTSNYPIIYRLVWKINSNDFVSDNLKYRVTSSNGGANTEFLTVPKTNNTVIARGITIPARSSQTYTLSFRFVGLNEEQNYDQGRQLNGLVTAEYDD